MFPSPSAPRKREPARAGIFVGKPRKLQYHEDIYSKRNPEEFREGRAEVCESESDSEDEAKTSAGGKKLTEKRKGLSPGFMERFSMPKGPSQMVDSDSFGVGETKSRQGAIGLHLEFPSEGKGIFNYLDEGPVRFPIHRDEPVGGLRSDPTTGEEPAQSNKLRTKLTPQRFGLFGGPFAFKLPGMQQNSAKEAMDDLPGPAGTEIEEDSFTMVATDTAEDAFEDRRAGSASKALQTTMNESASADNVDTLGEGNAIDPLLNDQDQQTFDADGDDEFDELGHARSAVLAMRSTESSNDKRKRTRKSNLAASPVRSSARLLKNLGIAKIGTKKSGSKLAASRAGPPKKGLAKKVTFEPIRKSEVARQGTKFGLRRRNWMGELIRDGPVVVVYVDEVEDVDEFMRCLREY